MAATTALATVMQSNGYRQIGPDTYQSHGFATARAEEVYLRDVTSKTGKLARVGTAKEVKARERAEAIDYLLPLCPPGTTIDVILRSVSRSGMMRQLSLLVVDQEGRLRDITYRVSLAIDNPTNDRGYLSMGGCGMDMGFAAVYSLSYALHGYESKGQGIEAERQGRPLRDTDPENYRAGYTLRHNWL